MKIELFCFQGKPALQQLIVDHAKQNIEDLACQVGSILRKFPNSTSTVDPYNRGKWPLYSICNRSTL